MTIKSFDQKSLAGLRFDRDDTGEDARVAELLRAEMAARFGPRDERPLSIRAQDADGAMVGGLNGVTHWRWLYVRHLWVEQAWRGRGLGRRLLERAEASAQERDCVGVYIDTFDPGAAAFYERSGFARFGAIDDFPKGSQRIYLSKKLGEAAPPPCPSPASGKSGR